MRQYDLSIKAITKLGSTAFQKLKLEVGCFNNVTSFVAEFTNFGKGQMQTYERDGKIGFIWYILGENKLDREFDLSEYIKWTTNI